MQPVRRFPGEADPDIVAEIAAEIASRCYRDATFQAEVDGFPIIPPVEIFIDREEEVVGAFRAVMVDPQLVAGDPAQLLAVLHEVAMPAFAGAHRIDHHLLRQGGGAVKLVHHHLVELLQKVFRGGDVAQAQAGKHIDLGEGEDRQGALEHPREAGDRMMFPSVKGHSVVGLVGEQPELVLLHQVGHRLQLGSAEHLAAGIIRRIEVKRGGFGGDEALQVCGDVQIRFLIKPAVKRRFHHHPAGQAHHAQEERPAGSQHQYFIAGIQQSHRADVQRIAGSAGEHDIVR